LATRSPNTTSGTAGPEAGNFVVNGQTLGANQDNYISSAQLAQTTYQSGSGADTLWVRVRRWPRWKSHSQVNG